MKDIILASASPRRKELLSYLNLPFTIYPSPFEETFSPSDDPCTVVTKLAKGKAVEVAKQFPQSIVIGSDTIVAGSKILGKPKNEEEAVSMLKELSGSTHSVWTAVSIISPERIKTFAEQVEVTFWPLSEEEIQAYVKTSDPYDKAGGYGIQSGGSLFVKQIVGDYYAVMGLPISRLNRELRDFLPD
ncbi:Maf family protein [Jeotgalibacillus proteolyticus]|uniref:dTTP/UTP pyrophosphatase n=1 Tax=Jeotgalibacillus proteolyticus TaxID=2082395 RepID=A0A2S5GES5_9BACL|nr:Maf family protein [Jeotgalibacillus proteolyticus]PPA71547.1 septum formation protein Maf [Jeotgalibacillus proteolyticus]